MDLIHGTLDLLVLRALAAGPAHGYSVARTIESLTKGAFVIEDTALYKSLHRLEAGGSIESDWGISELRRRAKYYQLTKQGRAMLRQETKVWERYAAAVFSVLRSSEA